MTQAQLIRFDHNRAGSMSSIANMLLQDALDTRDTHGGCISNGGFVLLTLANIASPELSNSSRVKSFDSLIPLVQHCIGAGCDPLFIENACPVAINLGYDVAAQRTEAAANAGGSAVAAASVAPRSVLPVGNTGRTSTGHEL